MVQMACASRSSSRALISEHLASFTESKSLLMLSRASALWAYTLEDNKLNPTQPLHLNAIPRYSDFHFLPLLSPVLQHRG